MTTTLTLCWRLERRDGITLGFTSHDRDLAHDGLTYRAAPGMLPSAIALSDGFDADALDVSGALTADAIFERDLEAGRWDGAAISVFAIDWEHPSDAIPLARGTLGAVASGAGGFTAELRGAVAALERPVVEETSPDCRAALGDPRCRVDLAGRTIFARVVAADDLTITLDRAEPVRDAYAFGTLRWLGGANAGLASPIAASEGSGVALVDPPAFIPAPGDLVRLTEGCDKRFDTCAERFANALNFRGEPWLPGNDLLTRYPNG